MQPKQRNGSLKSAGEMGLSQMRDHRSVVFISQKRTQQFAWMNRKYKLIVEED